MIRLTPSAELELFSPMKADEALQKLAIEIKPVEIRTSRIPVATDGRFQGQVQGNHFEMRRDIGYRNSFLPFIRGTIFPTSNGCVLRAEMKPHRSASRFMIIWFAIVAFCFLVLSIAMASAPVISAAAWLVEILPLFMLVFGVVIMMLGFYPETKIAKQFLQDALHAQEKDPHGA